MVRESLHKSKIIDGYRTRFLRKKEDDRWDWHGLKRAKNTQAAYDHIYTVEEAMTLGIKFRDNWRSSKPNEEKHFFSDNAY